MYNQHGIQQLSHPQVLKLLRGEAVTMKHGTHHTVHLSNEQSKKIQNAHRRNAGVRIMFDPYQIDQHRHLHGEGIGRAFKHLGRTISHGTKVVGSTLQKAGRATASALIHQGIPVTTGLLANNIGFATGDIASGGNPLVGMVSGAMAGKAGHYAGTKLADYIGRKTGYGMEEVPRHNMSEHYGEALKKRSSKKPLHSNLNHKSKIHHLPISRAKSVPKRKVPRRGGALVPAGY